MELRRRDQASDLLSPVASGGETGRAIVIEPWVKASPRRNAGAQASTRTPEARLEETAGLARAIDLTIVRAGLVTLSDIRPATYIGKGKVDEIAGMVKSLSASIVVMAFDPCRDCHQAADAGRAGTSNHGVQFGCKVRKIKMAMAVHQHSQAFSSAST